MPFEDALSGATELNGDSGQKIDIVHGTHTPESIDNKGIEVNIPSPSLVVSPQ